MFLEQKRYYYLYETDSLNYTYGRIGSPSGHPVQGKYGVETSGSSVTVTATDGTPFDPVNAGDIIVFKQPPDTKLVRTVDTWTSPTSIDVDTAVNLSAGTAWFFEPFKNGTTVNDGWHHVGAWSAISVFVRVETLNSTGIDVNLEGMGGDLSGPVNLKSAPTNITSTGTIAINVEQVITHLRVGLRVDTTVVAGDEVTVWAQGELLQTAGV